MNTNLNQSNLQEYCAKIPKIKSQLKTWNLGKIVPHLYLAATMFNISPATDFYPMPYQQETPIEPLKVEVRSNHLYPFKQTQDLSTIWQLESYQTATTSAEIIPDIPEPIKPVAIPMPTQKITKTTNQKPVVQIALETSSPSVVVTTKPSTANLVASDQLEAWFQQYAAQYNIDPFMLRQIAYCESTFRPDAVNGPYLGLFQFVSGTWQSNRRAMGLDPDPALRANPEEAIKTAAFKMGRDGYGAWPSCSRKAIAQLAPSS